MQDAFNRLIQRYMEYRYPKVDEMRIKPDVLQEKVFRRLLHAGLKTEYGYTHFVHDVKSYEDYKQAFPLRRYEDIAADIKRMMLGEKNVLCRGRVKWFAKSSGTSNSRSKYIPVTKSYLFNNHIRGNWDAVTFVHNSYPDSKIFARKNLLMGGSLQKFADNPKTIVGDISAIMVDNIPAVGRPFYTPDFKTALIDDWEVKIEKMSEICTQDSVHIMAGVPTWSMVLFDKILQKTGAQHMLEVWPEAIAYFHGGVSFEPYREQFSKYFPGNQIQYYEVYNASEGFFGLQDIPGRDDMLLLVNNENFFEFIPIEDYQKGIDSAITLKDIEVGIRYVIVVSNASGLWRYVIGDTIQFTSTYPHRFKIIGRTNQYINAFGEELMVINAEQGLQKTCSLTNAVIREYTVAPKYMEQGKRGSHEWAIEFIQAPDNLAYFEKLLDNTLQELNSDYAAKRSNNLALENLTVKILPKGHFSSWYKLKGKYGGQNKVPRLSNNRIILEELLAVQVPLKH